VRKPARERRIAEARRVLALLNFDRERTNERSALVLLALLRLRPSSPWSKASNPRLRTVELMAWLRERYERDYKPNTRETIRRQTLHQFIEAGLVLLNPDDPDRPVNSPNNCYQIEPRALKLLSSFRTARFDRLLAAYLDDIPGLRAQYERARTHHQIPVALPDGGAVTLTPGGQNLLIKQAVEEFCPRFTPGGRVLYVGDAGRQTPVFDQAALEDLGLTLDKHGKLPDLIVHFVDREWLVLIEAAASHGPVDSKRRSDLERLFAGSSAGIVFVSCFPSRDEMRRYLNEISWETEVWCADNPSHLIHFNGERFLGPYE
jgi:adenine-specific DNA-methyltransferase